MQTSYAALHGEHRKASRTVEGVPHQSQSHRAAQTESKKAHAPESRPAQAVSHQVYVPPRSMSDPRALLPSVDQQRLLFRTDPQKIARQQKEAARRAESESEEAQRVEFRIKSKAASATGRQGSSLRPIVFSRPPSTIAEEPPKLNTLTRAKTRTSPSRQRRAAAREAVEHAKALRRHKATAASDHLAEAPRPPPSPSPVPVALPAETGRGKESQLEAHAKTSILKAAELDECLRLMRIVTALRDRMEMFESSARVRERQWADERALSEYRIGRAEKANAEWAEKWEGEQRTRALFLEDMQRRLDAQIAALEEKTREAERVQSMNVRLALRLLLAEASARAWRRRSHILEEEIVQETSKVGDGAQRLSNGEAAAASFRQSRPGDSRLLSPSPRSSMHRVLVGGTEESSPSPFAVDGGRGGPLASGGSLVEAVQRSQFVQTGRTGEDGAKARTTHTTMPPHFLPESHAVNLGEGRELREDLSPSPSALSPQRRAISPDRIAPPVPPLPSPSRNEQTFTRTSQMRHPLSPETLESSLQRNETYTCDDARRSQEADLRMSTAEKDRHNRSRSLPSGSSRERESQIARRMGALRHRFHSNINTVPESVRASLGVGGFHRPFPSPVPPSRSSAFGGLLLSPLLSAASPGPTDPLTGGDGERERERGVEEGKEEEDPVHIALPSRTNEDTLPSEQAQPPRLHVHPPSEVPNDRAVAPDLDSQEKKREKRVDHSSLWGREKREPLSLKSLGDVPCPQPQPPSLGAIVAPAVHTESFHPLTRDSDSRSRDARQVQKGPGSDGEGPRPRQPRPSLSLAQSDTDKTPPETPTDPFTEPPRLNENTWEDDTRKGPVSPLPSSLAALPPCTERERERGKPVHPPARSGDNPLAGTHKQAPLPVPLSLNAGSRPRRSESDREGRCAREEGMEKGAERSAGSSPAFSFSLSVGRKEKGEGCPGKIVDSAEDGGRNGAVISSCRKGDGLPPPQSASSAPDGLTGKFPSLREPNLSLGVRVGEGLREVGVAPPDLGALPDVPFSAEARDRGDVFGQVSSTERRLTAPHRKMFEQEGVVERVGVMARVPVQVPSVGQMGVDFHSSPHRVNARGVAPLPSFGGLAVAQSEASRPVVSRDSAAAAAAVTELGGGSRRDRRATEEDFEFLARLRSVEQRLRAVMAGETKEYSHR
uniref:Uncharacterized protein n=1 Tax=Chromera velia CCMP2878 TaxID=1169474 RepID=A0A0G4FH17_9ALVE|eukprot:Cvel_3300.t1-p1 / transcript=Cvel_3300.t1 / gene=Cvel_3300 / organism=Chromera_velia_CCMP2878 / gene_product=hypothetical protein / transcript_product=hypothetical protein / location=Cvel_scaffold130:113421-118948(-) / protein_length=1173 / sequence_SO=supercontig / SO=protein_coding / is_pseudo=false